MTQPTTTLAKIKAARPCDSRWKIGLRKAGGLRKYGADTPITVRQIIEAMGLDDALWCLRTMPEHDRLWRLLVVRYARRSQHLMTDPRIVAALDVAERFAKGLSTAGGLAAAEAAVWAAARAAAWAAEAAAWAAGAAAGAAEREWQSAELIKICEEDI